MKSFIITAIIALACLIGGIFIGDALNGSQDLPIKNYIISDIESNDTGYDVTIQSYNTLPTHLYYAFGDTLPFKKGNIITCNWYKVNRHLARH